MWALINVLVVVLIVAAALFVLTFAVYLLNLDMKLMAKIQPIFERHYDKVERDQHL